MSLGTAYLRPQLLTRHAATEELRALDQLLELVSLLARDQAAGGPAAQKMGSGAQAAANRFFAEIERRLSRAESGFKSWFQPVVDVVKEGQAAGDAGPGAGILALLNLLKSTLEDLGTDDLNRKLNELLDVFQDDLGLNEDTLVGFMRDLVDTLVDELNADYLTGTDTEEARRCFLIGSRIAALRSFLLEQIPFVHLGLSRTQLIDAITHELRLRNWDEIRDKLLELLTPVCEGVQTVAELIELLQNGIDFDFEVEASAEVSGSGSVSGSVSGSGSVGGSGSTVSRGIAARGLDDPQMSWYASWFFDSRWTGGYHTAADRFDLGSEDYANRMHFGEFDAEFMEQWAHLTSAFTDLSEALLHGASIERGDFVANLLQLLWQTLKGGMTLGAYNAKGEGWAKLFSVFDNYFFEYLLNSTVVFSGLGSLEKNPGTFLAWLLANYLPDAAESLLYGIWGHSTREFFLSLFTLINHDQSAAPNAENYRQTDGFVMAFAEVGIWLGAFLPRYYPGAWGGKKHYGFPSHGGAGDILKLISYWLLTVGYAFAFAAIGVEVAGVIAGKKDDTYFERGGWQLPIWGVVKFPLYWFMWWDRQTGGGDWGIDSDSNRTLVDMPGYPDPETSPYLLPYPPDQLIQCVQSHHGIFSHNTKTSQVYAVDFAHNEGDPVLAMRGGTVVAFRDHIRDNDTSTWNHIVIRHDDPNEAQNPHPEHDRDHNGVATTYAQYGHGRQYGVRHAFATRGIPHSAIIGAKVLPGELIMYAGDTGMSAYNHLHVHVYSSPPTHFPYRTIPWVFRDLERKKLLGFIPIGRQGVPRAFDYYPSTNTPLELADISLYHPEHLIGSITNSGNNWVELASTARDRDDWYQDRHLRITYANSAGQTVYEYKKIVAYEGDNRRATIQGRWTRGSNPPNGAQYEIGAPPYASANENFHKKFAYLAEVDGGGTPQNFADDREPYTYANIALYHRLVTQGSVQGGGLVSGDTVVLEAAASADADAYVGHHLQIERSGQPIQYRRISAYDGSTRTATIEGTWDLPLQTGASADTYRIGAAAYDDPERDEVAAFLAPQSGETVNDFPDGRSPFNYSPT